MNVVRRNSRYLIVFLVSLLIFLLGLANELGLIQAFKINVIEGNGGFIEFQRFLLNSNWSFSTAVIFGSVWFQIIIPLFSIFSGLVFYSKYNSILKLEMHKHKKFSREIHKEMMLESAKLALAIYLSFFLFLLVTKIICLPDAPREEARSMFTDIIGNKLYRKYTFAYFTLEGFVRFFLMPYMYSMLAQSAVLLSTERKYTIIFPIAYYYGLSTIGYALFNYFPNLAVYLNPSVIMASGTYSFNTIILLLVNAIPLIFSNVIIRKETRYVEI